MRPRHLRFNRFFLKMNIALFITLLWEKTLEEPAIGCGSFGDDIANNVADRLLKMIVSLIVAKILMKGFVLHAKAIKTAKKKITMTSNEFKIFV